MSDLTTDETDETRTMVCPVCGFTCKSRGIGAIYCGPHRVAPGPDGLSPAVRMREVQEDGQHE